MKRTIRTDEQIIGNFKHEAGAKCADFCRTHGTSDGMFYVWNANYFGTTVSEGRQCCAIGPSDNGDATEGIGGGNREAEAALGRTDARHSGDEGVAVKKVVVPVTVCSAARACQIAGADRKMVLYKSHRAPATALRNRLSDMANERRLYVLLRREGEPSEINRIYWLYSEEGLTLRKRKARRKAIKTWATIFIEARADVRWSLDFVNDHFTCGRRSRVLNVVHDVTRERLAAIPDTSISGRRVARELTELIERRGKPGMIVSDRAIVAPLVRAQ